MQLKLPELPSKIISQLQQAGFECYAVGGGIRDLLRGKSPTDWDFTTDATPQEILKVFPDGYYDNKFGTVGIPMKDSIVEITTYRTESAYKDNPRPEKMECS